MIPTLHIDIVMHLFREHFDIMMQIASNWPEDANGNKIPPPKGELPEEITNIIVKALFQEKDPEERPAPYRGKNMVTNRPNYLPPAMVAKLGQREFKRVPPKYITPDPKNKEYHANLPPLEIPGESGDQSKFGPESLPSLYGRELRTDVLTQEVEAMLDDDQKYQRDFKQRNPLSNSILEDNQDDPDLQVVNRRTKQDMGLFGETVSEGGEDEAGVYSDTED